MKLPANFSTFRRKSQRGMTLMELLVASIVFLVGMIGTLSMFSYSVATMSWSDNEMIARQKAREAMESVVAARNSASYSWSAMANAPAGIFTNGQTNMTQFGADGIVSTSDDSGVETILLPNGKTRVLLDFRRQIAITPAIVGGAPSPTLRVVTITITYPRGGQFGQGTYSMIGYISQWN